MHTPLNALENTLYVNLLIFFDIFLINEDISSGLLAIFSAEASEALTRPLCAILTKYCPAILEKEKTRHFLPFQSNMATFTTLTTRCTQSLFQIDTL